MSRQKEDDLLADPHDLPGEVLVEVNEKVEGFLEIIRIKLERLEPLDIFETPAGGCGERRGNPVEEELALDLPGHVVPVADDLPAGSQKVTVFTLFRGEDVHPFQHVALEQPRELPAVPPVGLDPVARLRGDERGWNNEYFYAILHQLIGEPEAEGAGLVGHLHPAALVALKELLQRLVLPRDAAVEDLFSICPNGDLPALLVHVDPHVDILPHH